MGIDSLSQDGRQPDENGAVVPCLPDRRNRRTVCPAHGRHDAGAGGMVEPGPCKG
jgi:hypothetical protein